MKKSIKKTLSILICLTFLLSAVMVSTASNEISVPASVTIGPSEPVSTSKDIIVLRYGSDNTITPLRVKIQIKEGQDLGELIADKCQELFDNDPEMQINFSTNNSSTNVLSKIRSYGRGFHFKSTFRMQLLQKLKLFPFLPPYFRTAIFIPMNYCKYTTDPKAKTVVTSILTGVNKTYEGPHSVLNVGFVGYSGWIGHISYMGFIFRTGFAGVTVFSVCREL